MTEWLKEQKERIERDIKMHENCLNGLRVQLNAIYTRRGKYTRSGKC